MVLLKTKKQMWCFVMLCCDHICTKYSVVKGRKRLWVQQLNYRSCAVRASQETWGYPCYLGCRDSNAVLVLLLLGSKSHQVLFRSRVLTVYVLFSLDNWPYCLTSSSSGLCSLASIKNKPGFSDLGQEAASGVLLKQAVAYLVKSRAPSWANQRAVQSVVMNVILKCGESWK